MNNATSKAKADTDAAISKAVMSRLDAVALLL
jgi:hypothetical protein